MKIFSSIMLIFIIAVSCNNNSVETNKTDVSTPNTETAKPLFQLIAQYPHDASSFTEGLEFRDSTLYESTGLFGQSKLARVNLKTGKDILKIDIDKKYFGEGITMLNGKIYQLTYQTEKAFLYDAKTFKKLNEFSYKGEGWGMTNDGKQLIMSNGSNNLIYRNATTFAEENTIAIFDENGKPLDSINELEYVDGFIYANIWQTDCIVKIDIAKRKVVSKYDFINLRNQYIAGNQNADVLNGIAYNPKTKNFYITGKNWNLLFEVKLN